MVKGAAKSLLTQSGHRLAARPKRVADCRLRQCSTAFGKNLDFGHWRNVVIKGACLLNFPYNARGGGIVQ